MACDGKIEQEQNNEVKYWIQSSQNISSLSIQQLDGKLSSAENLSIELKIILKFQSALFKCKKLIWNTKPSIELHFHFLPLRTQSFYS